QRSERPSDPAKRWFLRPRATGRMARSTGLLSSSVRPSSMALPTAGARRSRRIDDRKIMNGIFFVLRTGIPWRDLPERYGPYTTAYNRFNRWSARGIWGRMFAALAAKSPDSLQMIDSTILQAHPPPPRP